MNRMDGDELMSYALNRHTSCFVLKPTRKVQDTINPMDYALEADGENK